MAGDHQMLELMPDAVIVCDRDGIRASKPQVFGGTETVLNDPGRMALGTRPTAAYGRGVKEVSEMTTRIVPEELVELDSPFAEFFRTLGGPWPFRPLLALAPGKRFIPTGDVFARNGSLVVKLDLPGLDPKDIHVKVFEGELTVTGERKADKEVKEEGYYRKETTYGFFERHVSVPKGIKESDIKAEYGDGVLEISMPRSVKAEELPKAKEIPVKHAVKPIKA